MIGAFWVLALAVTVLFLVAGWLKSFLSGLVILLCGVAGALAIPARRSFETFRGWLARLERQGAVAAVFQIALLFMCVAAAIADFHVLLGTIRVVWPTELAPWPLALGLVLLTTALGYLLHRTNSRGMRIAVLAVVFVLAATQSVLAWKRAIEVQGLEQLIANATAQAPDSGGFVMGGKQMEMAAFPVRETEAWDGFFGAAVLSAAVAFFLAIAGALTAWGLAQFSRGELIWCLCAPWLLVTLLTLAALEVVAALRDPSCEFVGCIFEPLLVFRARVFAMLRSLIPGTAEFTARREGHLDQNGLLCKKEFEFGTAKHTVRLGVMDQEHEREKRRLVLAADLRETQEELRRHGEGGEDTPAKTPTRETGRGGWTSFCLFLLLPILFTGCSGVPASQDPYVTAAVDTASPRCIVVLWDVSGSFASINDVQQNLSGIVAALGPGDEFVLVQVGGPFDEKKDVVVECRMPEIPPEFLIHTPGTKQWKKKQVALSAVWGEVERRRKSLLQFLPTVKPSPRATTPLDDATLYAASRLARGHGLRFLLVLSDLIQDSDGVKRDGPPPFTVPLSDVRVTAMFIPWDRKWQDREKRWSQWFAGCGAQGFQMFDGSQSKGMTVIQASSVPRLVPGHVLAEGETVDKF